MSRLSEIHESYEAVMSLAEGNLRDRALSNLMDVMKAEFHIPLLENREWEQENPKVIALYRKISNSRSF